MYRKLTIRPWRLLLVLTGCVTLALLPAPSAATPAGDLDRFVASLEGGWSGEENMTPLGKMGFAVLFKRQEDGSLHARSSLNSETYIDLRFLRDRSGRWLLCEEAGMEGSGVQAYSLIPGGMRDGMYRWTHEQRPDFLTIDIARRDDTLLMNVTLRGEDHARYRLERLPEEAWPGLEREMKRSALLSPEEGVSIFDMVQQPPAEARGGGSKATDAPRPIAEARALIADKPDDARARLALAGALGAAIDAKPADGPRYAFEMLGSLQKAIELDPTLGEAYHWLVGYYLSAPPIAGGSLDRAEETARRLAEFDPDGGRSLMAQVEARRSAAE